MDNLNDNQTRKVNFLKRKYLIVFIGILLGVIGGYFYYVKVGCVSGSCPITSNPWMSMAWGGAIGYLVGDIFRTKANKNSVQD